MILILLLPFITFLLLGLAGKRLKPGMAGIIGTVGMACVTALAYMTAFTYFGNGRNAEGICPTQIPFNVEWLSFTETLHIDLGMMLDPISVMMLIVISTVSLAVHFYSLGYMKGEQGFQRYFAFLSLFTMSMLGLVVATNIFQMYLFWELVGVSSYLLIGFYYTKPAAIAAAKKAFIVTRFADLGFLIGILIYGYYTQTFTFTPEHHALVAAGGMIPLALGLMFVGGAGKSAMFPLHIWLPDAMEGPTPVSALIHAATMVVAGVYLLARLFPLFIGFAPDVLHIAGYVGAFTALFAAVIACVQTDIKRVLAFSTISQIGFMIVALGVCTSSDPHHGGLGYMASMFHLFTHAMFKALLFLCAGAVIHAVHSNEIKDMGGLRKFMPVTHITFLIACLAIAGIPPFSGFFSKDEILAACFQFSPVMGIIMSAIAGLTAFYMFRLYYCVFWGKTNQWTIDNGQLTMENNGHHAVPLEAPFTMTVPLILLAAVTCVAGFVPFGEFISSNGEAYSIHLDWTVAGASIFVAILGIALATLMYKGTSVFKKTVQLAAGLTGLQRVVFNRFYIDEIYQFVTHKIIFACISTPVAWFDRNVVDGFMNSLAWITNETSERIRGFQSGNIQHYTIIFISGILVLIVLLLLI
jgi:NADH-quinone oxidoreductase subunit L